MELIYPWECKEKKIIFVKADEKTQDRKRNKS